MYNERRNQKKLLAVLAGIGLPLLLIACSDQAPMPTTSPIPPTSAPFPTKNPVRPTEVPISTKAPIPVEFPITVAPIPSQPPAAPTSWTVKTKRVDAVNGPFYDNMIEVNIDGIMVGLWASLDEPKYSNVRYKPNPRTAANCGLVAHSYSPLDQVNLVSAGFGGDAPRSEAWFVSQYDDKEASARASMAFDAKGNYVDSLDSESNIFVGDGKMGIMINNVGYALTGMYHVEGDEKVTECTLAKVNQ
jgi:hypothetical protein